MIDEERQERVNRLKNLRILLDSMESSRVTLIGDVMLDRYHHGYANNLNSTAPVPVLKITSSEESPCAAAHIARGLHSLGLSVAFYSCVGGDSEGQTIKSLLNEDGIDVSGIELVHGVKTLTKIRFYGSRQSLLDQEQILLQADRGPLDDLDKSVSSSLVDSALTSIPNSCALVISDYDKGVLTDEGAQILINSAKEHKIPSIVDPKLTGLERSRGATVVLFEIRGLELLRRRLMLEDSSLTAKHLIDEYEWDSLVILGGVNGVTLYQSNGDVEHHECNAQTPIQQIGLHDAAATALAASLGHQNSMSDAVALVSAACDCVLSAEASHEFVDRKELSLWLDDLSWQLQISDR